MHQGHKGHHKRGQRHRVEGYQYSRPSQQHSSYGGSSYYGGYASSPVGAPFKQQQEAGSFRCSRAGFFSHETDCTRFYRCVDYYGNGRYLTLYRFVCAEGTIFDPSLSVCNHPSWISPPPKCAGNTSPIVPPPHQPPVGPVHPSPTQPPPVVPTGPVYPSPPQPTITPLQPPTKPPVYPSPHPATQAPFVPGPATATEPQQPPVTLTPPGMYTVQYSIHLRLGVIRDPHFFFHCYYDRMYGVCYRYKPAGVAIKNIKVSAPYERFFQGCFYFFKMFG